MKKYAFTLLSLLVLFAFPHESNKEKKFSEMLAHAPTPLADRVVLTWNDNPATTQSVSWRTDTSVSKGLAQVAIANDNGRALEPLPLSFAIAT